MALTPQFGIFLVPLADDPGELFRQVKIADEAGLDLVFIQDHPYQPRFFETWTLLTALGMSTERIHFSPGVADLPLRHPAVLAKQAATLDVMSGGRVELGLGAGAYWDAIAGFGGPKRAPAEAYAAYEDALHILHGLWDHPGKEFSYSGKVYSLQGAKFGPAPSHHIPIWAGAVRPKMLRLAGRMADGLFVTFAFFPPERLPHVHTLVDEGAREAGRSPDEIRRGNNIHGVIRPGTGSHSFPAQPGVLDGTAGYWVDQLTAYYREQRQDAFSFWASGDVAQQTEVFAREVVPAVKERLGLAVS